MMRARAPRHVEFGAWHSTCNRATRGGEYVDGERAAGQMASIWRRWQARPTWWGGRRMSLLVHTGRLTVVAVRWRRRYQLVRQELRVVRLRLQMPWRIAYYVLPAGLRGRRKHEAATDAQAVAPRARIIVNRTSGSVHGAFGLNELAETAKWLGAHGIPAEVRETAYAGQAEVLAREAARACMKLVNYVATHGQLTGTPQSQIVWMRAVCYARSVNAFMI